MKVVALAAALLAMVPAAEAQTFGRGATIGISVREVAPDETARAKLDRPGGVYVVEVREGGPGARAGLRSGDVVAAFDGERIRGVRHFSRLVSETPDARAVAAEIVREGRRQTVTITPEPGDAFAGFTPEALVPEIRREVERSLRTLPQDLPVPGPRGARARLGLTLTPLTDQLASYFGVKEGVLVSAVGADSPASRAGIRAGDVIVALDGRPARTPADVTSSARAAAAGAALDVRVMRDRKELRVKVAIPEDQPSRPV